MIPDRRSFLLQNIREKPFCDSGGRINLSIAGVRVDWITSSRPLQQSIREYFREYISDEGEPVAELCAEPFSESGFPSLWEDADPEFDIREDSVVQRDFVARWVASRRAVALVAPGEDDAIHNLLRWFLPRALLSKSAFLLHGAAVIRDGRGYVFFGQSGAGKSTTVSMIGASDPESRVIGDDGVIVQMKRTGDGREVPWVFAAPLGCGYSREAPPAISAPISGLFALAQDRMDAVESMSRTQGTAALLASAMTVRMDESIDDRFDLARRFAESNCSIRRLRLKKSPEFWQGLIMQRSCPVDI